MQSIQAIYQPVNESCSEIRLVEILSHNSDGKIQCRLSVSSLKEKPEFTALSYVWGDPKITEDIILNGEIFSVTTNLAAALRYVKSHWCSYFPDRDSNIFRIWVDAICINQQDEIERGSQVNLMREIYSKAELVLSWLGHGIDEIDQAFDILETIVKEARELGNEPAGVEWLKNYPAWCVEFDESKAYLDLIKAFFELPYWQRVWIFQELVLGTRILFVHGSTTMTYEDLYQANEWIRFTQKSIESGKIQKPDFLHPYIWLRFSNPYFHIAPVLMVSLYKERGVEKNPWVMFYLCSRLQATDPRDHIYGLLGLGNFEIVPNYRKDFSSVLQDLVCAWIKDSNKLDCLLHAGVGILDRGSFGFLPSWAPNFSFVSLEGKGQAFFESGHADQDVFAAAAKAPTLIDLALRVSALLGPAVVKVYEAFPLEAWVDGRMYEFAQDYVRRATSQARGVHPLKAVFDVIRNMVNKESDPAASGEPMVRLAIGVLKAFLAHPEAVKLSVEERFALLGVPLGDEFADTFFNILFPGESFDKQAFLAKFCSIEYSEKEMQRIWLQTQATQAYFRFTEIEGGYLSMTPRFSRPGDVVAILKGCKVPLILRKHEDHYIIIGTSNIPGLMEGEAKGLCESGHARFEDIQIR